MFINIKNHDIRDGNIFEYPVHIVGYTDYPVQLPVLVFLEMFDSRGISIGMGKINSKRNNAEVLRQIEMWKDEKYCAGKYSGIFHSFKIL